MKLTVKLAQQVHGFIFCDLQQDGISVAEHLLPSDAKTIAHRVNVHDDLERALELAQSHIDWLWDQLEESTRLKRDGSEAVHSQIRAALERAKQ